MMTPCNRRSSQHEQQMSSPVDRQDYDNTSVGNVNRGRYYDADDDSRAISLATSATASSSSIFSTPTSNSNPSTARVPFSSVINSNPTTHLPLQQQQDQEQQRRRQSQHLDWKVKSIVRRSSSIAQTEVAHRISNSPFLTKQRRDTASMERVNNIPLLHRDEIVVGRLIGSGGFSNVHQITELKLDAAISQRCTEKQQENRIRLAERVNNGIVRLVIKHLKRKMALSSTKEMSHAACDLMMEASYMSVLNHPNILPIRGLPIDHLAAYASGAYDGYFIIMDELSNTLGDEILHWQKNLCDVPSIDEKTDYAVQIASAINYLHVNCNMIFRDLKPQNIGFDTQTGTIQLFDFGLCRDVPSSIDGDMDDENENEVYEMSGVGTRRYMAPEIINDHRYNAKVDVYSWAMVFNELLTGNKPYASYDVEEHRVAVCQGGERPRLHMFWPTYIRTVLQKSWCESVRERWSMQDVLLFLARSVSPVPRHQPSNATQLLAPSTLSILDSPIAVEQINDFYIVPPPSSDRILLPELPDLQGSSEDNSHTTSSANSVLETCLPNISILPQLRRHSIFPNMIVGRNIKNNYDFYTDDDHTSEVFMTDPRTMNKSPHLTMCKVDGSVEIVEGVDPTRPVRVLRQQQQQQQSGSPSLRMNPHRRSCVL